MAEIKSSVEIALERAAAMGAAADDQAREDGRRKGKALVRRFTVGEIDQAGLAEELGRLGAEEIGFARTAGLETVWDELRQGDPKAVAGLEVLAEGTEAASVAEELASITRAKREQEYKLLEQLTIEMAEGLATAGIKGSAVIPNPAAHPDLEARLQEVDAQWAGRRAQLLEGIGAVLLEL